MNRFETLCRPPRRIVAVLLAALVAGCGSGGGGGVSVGGAPGPAGPSPRLGTAATYGVISGATVTLNGTASIVGNLAIDPANARHGTGTVSGTTNNGNTAAHQARLDQSAAFTEASTRVISSPCAVSGNLVAMPSPPCGNTPGTFVPGLYKSGGALTIAAGGTIILDAKGNSNAVFIFQMGSTLTTGASSTVALRNGAQAKNVWWVAPAGATLGGTAVFAGTVLANTGAVIVGDGTMAEGRMFSNSAAVTVNTGSTITVPAP